MIKVLRSNVILRNCLRARLRNIAFQSQSKIARAFRGRYYKKLFKKGIYIATLYLETPDYIDRSKPV
jgi:hypothetical protein